MEGVDRQQWSDSGQKNAAIKAALQEEGYVSTIASTIELRLSYLTFHYSGMWRIAVRQLAALPHDKPVHYALDHRFSVSSMCPTNLSNFWSKHGIPCH